MLLRRTTVLLLLLLPTGSLAHQSRSDSPPCSLNGNLLPSGSCQCDKPWSGDDCSQMNFLPARRAYGSPNALTTWGGSAICDGSLCHLYVSATTNNCSLARWGRNSRIDHAVSKDIMGPYEFKDVAVNTWSHNAAPVKLGEGNYAIFHIGSGDGPPVGPFNCTSPHPGDDSTISNDNMGSFRVTKERKAIATVDPLQAHRGYIHVSTSLDGPWTSIQPNTIGDCNNPAPWAHPNGTLFVVCRRVSERGQLLSAESVAGPWKVISTIPSEGGPLGNYEDPFLYTNERGFHILYHVYNKTEHAPSGHECVDSTVSGHVYSPDGYTWYTSPNQPYGTQVEMDTGDVITLSTKERPKLVFDDEGKMTHLFVGACAVPNCRRPCDSCKFDYWDYTLVLPLDM